MAISFELTYEDYFDRSAPMAGLAVIDMIGKWVELNRPANATYRINVGSEDHGIPVKLTLSAPDKHDHEERLLVEQSAGWNYFDPRDNPDSSRRIDDLSERISSLLSKFHGS